MNSSWLDLAFRGGPVMAPIFAGSILALAIIIDRFLFLFSTREKETFLASALDEAANAASGSSPDSAGISRRPGQNANEAASPNPALEKLKQSPGAVAALWTAGLEALPEGKEATERAMQIAGSHQIARAERGLTLLSAVITLEPMLGFLGTITGMIRAFMTWERMGAEVQISSLASGMYEAMITTAGGLMVAIPYYFLYVIINSRIAALARRLESAHESFLRRLSPAMAIHPFPGVEAPEIPLDAFARDESR